MVTVPGKYRGLANHLDTQQVSFFFGPPTAEVFYFYKNHNTIISYKYFLFICIWKMTKNCDDVCHTSYQITNCTKYEHIYCRLGFRQ